MFKFIYAAFTLILIFSVSSIFLASKSEMKTRCSGYDTEKTQEEFEECVVDSFAPVFIDETIDYVVKILAK